MRFLFLFIFLFISNISHAQYQRRFYYELNEARIYSRWRIQDEYKFRNKTENFLDRKERYLDQAERAYALNQREEDLRRSGVIPPRHPDAGKFFYKDKKYGSYELFKETPEYVDFLVERRLKEIDKKSIDIEKEVNRIRDNAFLMMWHKLSDIGKEKFNQLSSREKELRIDEAVLDYITL